MATAKRKKALANLPDSIELRKNLSRYADDPRLPRVAMMAALSSNPKARLSELATASGRCKRTIQKYLTILAEEGVESLLAPLGRPNKLTDDEVEQVRAAIRTNRFESPDKARAWIAEHLGITFSKSGIHRFLKNQLAVRSVLSTASKHRQTEPSTNRPTRDELLELMNSLSLKLDKITALRALSDGLLRLLRGTAYVLVTCVESLPDPERPANPDIRRIRYEPSSAEREGVEPTTAVTGITSDAEKETVRASILRLIAKRPDINLDDHLPPKVHLYHVNETRYIGSITPLYYKREPSNRRLKVEHEEILKRLERVLTFIVSDIVLRALAKSTNTRVRHRSFDDLALRYSLTKRQKEVALLYLEGSRYREIADTLEIAESTVKGHIHNIHQKCGTASAAELGALLDNLSDR